MFSFFKLFTVSAITFAVLDFIWLGFIMKSFNMAQLAEIGRFKDGEFDMLYGPAIVVYVLMAASVTFFVLPRIGAESPIWLSFLIGGAMGLIAYGIFDMTNMAILKNYPWPFALADITWGTFAYGLVTVITKTVRDL